MDHHLRPSRTPSSDLSTQEPDRPPAGQRPQIGFVPGGEHILRWFCDPQGQHWRILQMHEGRPMPRGRRCRTLCPDFCRAIDPTGAYPPCALCQDGRLRREELVLFYGALYKTSTPSEYWQPGRTYVMVAPTAIRAGLTLLLTQGSDTQRECFFTMLNPRLPSPAVVLRVQKGPKASVTLTAFTAETFPPLTLGAWHRPLRTCWLHRFNLMDYEAVLAAVTGQPPKA